MFQNSDLSLRYSNECNRRSDLTAAFTHPDDVLRSGVLSDGDKRQILAAWASDAHTVPNQPAMRKLDSGAVVSIDTVLAALRALDTCGTLESGKAEGKKHNGRKEGKGKKKGK